MDTLKEALTMAKQATIELNWTILIALIFAFGLIYSSSVEAGGQGKGRPDKANKGKGADKDKGHQGNCLVLI